MVPPNGERNLALDVPADRSYKDAEIIVPGGANDDSVMKVRPASLQSRFMNHGDENPGIEMATSSNSR
jgi:hypothetical protein